MPIQIPFGREHHVCCPMSFNPCTCEGEGITFERSDLPRTFRPGEGLRVHLMDVNSEGYKATIEGPA